MLLLKKDFLTCSGHRLKYWQLVKQSDALNQRCQLLARFLFCVSCEVVRVLTAMG